VHLWHDVINFKHHVLSWSQFKLKKAATNCLLICWRVNNLQSYVCNSEKFLG
jgi:hypothetical protein